VIDPALLDELAAALGPDAERDAPIGPLTTYRVGGTARLLVRARTVEQVQSVGRALAGSGVPVVALGRGSNLLVADCGFQGVVVLLGDELATIAIEGMSVRVGAAAALPVVARQTAAAGLTGFEWAVGVPGSIGGAVRMNAGGHGSDMAASLVSVRVVDLNSGAIETIDAATLGLGVRRSDLGDSRIVVEAELRLDAGDREVAEHAISEIVRWRRSHQPGGANAGSVFVNPPGEAAGRLLDEAGARGLRVGTASVSTKHANFIQTDDEGSADDVRRLMIEMRRLVRERFGIELRAETHLLGFTREEADAVGARSTASGETTK
jgi:UDP-N-acetylmuramate dehydrogenase